MNEDPIKSLHETTVDMKLGKKESKETLEQEDLTKQFEDIWNNSQDPFWHHLDLLKVLQAVDNATKSKKKLREKYKINNKKKVVNGPLPNWNILRQDNLNNTNNDNLDVLINQIVSECNRNEDPQMGRTNEDDIQMERSFNADNQMDKENITEDEQNESVPLPTTPQPTNNLQIVVYTGIQQEKEKESSIKETEIESER